MEFERLNFEGDTDYDKLQSYEIAALCNLNPDSVEAARTLIPRLALNYSVASVYLHSIHILNVYILYVVSRADLLMKTFKR